MPVNKPEPKGQLFATYVQAVRTLSLSGSDDHRTRKQWIIVPPHLSPTNDGLFLLYTRTQERMHARPQWSNSLVQEDLLARDLTEKLNLLRSENENLAAKLQWEISPLITCEVTESEVREWHDTRKTPWPALNRFAKVASRRHGFTI